MSTRAMRGKSNRNLRVRRLGPRTNSGSLSETAAALAIVLPIALFFAFVAWQVSQVYMIKTTLSLAAQSAARRLAINYGKDPVMTMAFPEQTFSQIKHMGIVVSPDQFSIPVGTAGWNVAANPPTVTVQVEFQGGQYGLPPFPNPDPLGLGTNFKIIGVGKSRLE